MQLESISLHHIGKPAQVLLIPWRKYSKFFDNGCWDIWGLSPLLKYTILYFVVFILASLFGVVNLDQNSKVASIYLTIFILGFLIIAFIWFFYLPILSLIVLFRTFKKIKNSVNQLISYFKKSPWEMTPMKLYNQPKWAIVFYLIYIKDLLVDILDWTTQYYPISILSISPTRYPLSMKIRHISKLFDCRIAQLNIPLKYEDFEINQQFTLYKFGLYEDVKDWSKVVKKLKKGFKYNYGFYINEENEKINIIVPHAQ